MSKERDEKWGGSKGSSGWSDYLWGRPSPGYVGLDNLGNTCFMNATLQALLHTPCLVELALSGKLSAKSRRSACTVSDAFASLVDDFWSGNYSSMRPKYFVETFASRVDRSYGNGRQRDAQEFLAALLGALHAETNTVVYPRACEQNYTGANGIHRDEMSYHMERKRHYANSAVDEMFNVTFEDSRQLTVQPLPANRGNRIALVNCLTNLLIPEDVSQSPEHCPRCYCGTIISERMEVWSLPDVIVVHLKRFTSNHWGQVVKDSRAVDFSDGFDMKLAMSTSAPVKQWPTTKYTLYAVVSHSGQLDYGHYTATVRHPHDGKWVHFNDNTWSESASPSEGNCPNAYLFFYARADKCPGGTSSATGTSSSSRYGSARSGYY